MNSVHINLLKLNHKKFRRQFGVKPLLFELLIGYLSSLYCVERSCYLAGRKCKLSMDCKLAMFLYYVRKYDTYEGIGIIFGVSTTHCFRIVNWVLDRLLRCGLISIDGLWSDTLLIDATEVKIEKPKYFTDYYYSGKKKIYSVKLQVVIDNDRRVLCLDACEGSIHDFKLFEISCLDVSDCNVIVDKGYIGIDKYSKGCLVGKKKSKNNPLSKSDASFNRMVAKTRIVNEHVIGSLKRFKCLSSTFRHCNDVVSKILNLAVIIAGFHNFELIH